MFGNKLSKVEEMEIWLALLKQAEYTSEFIKKVNKNQETLNLLLKHLGLEVFEGKEIRKIK